MIDERILRTLENAMVVIKDPKSVQDLYMALRLIAAVAKQESIKVQIAAEVNK